MAQETQNTYLSNLKFEPSLSRGFIARYFGNLRLVFLMLMVVLISGIYSYINLPRELNPTIDIALVVVSTALPGAGPEEVEALVTKPLEKEISGIDGMTKYTSTSTNSFSTIVVEFEDSITREKASAEVQSAVDAVNNLPEDATTPNVNDIDFNDVPIWTFTLSAGDDIPGLDRFSQRLQEQIELYPGVDRADVSGLQNREIQIVINSQLLTERNISYFELQNAISSALSSYPVGDIKTDNFYYTVSIDQNILSIQDLRNKTISVGGITYTLSDIAQVHEITSPLEGKSFKANPGTSIEQVVTFNVYKKPAAKINETVVAVKEIVEEETRSFDHIRYETVTDYAFEIDDQFNDLIRNFSQTVLLVFAVMLIFLGFREAFLATISIPLTVLIGFTVMFGTGVTLNFISIFSLLIALGMLVDNTVVVVSAVNSYYKTGKFTPYETGLLVFKDFFIPLISTNLTTVWAFLPLLLATGIIGKFIEPIPIIVSTIIIASALVGFFLVLPISLLVLAPNLPRRVQILSLTIGAILFAVVVFNILPDSPLRIVATAISILILFLVPSLFKLLRETVSKFLNQNDKRKSTSENISNRLDRGFIDLSRVGEWYKSKIHIILNSKTARWKVIIAIVALAIFTYLLPILGFVPNIFFPSGDADIINISVELPLGSGIQTSEEESFRLVNELKDKPYIENIVSELGKAPPESGLPSGSNLILFTINLKPIEERDQTSIQIAADLRKEYATSYTKGKFSVVELSGGPPAGADIEIKLSGDDLQVLSAYAAKVQEHLSQKPNVTNVTQSIKTGTSKFTFVPNNKKLAEYGVSESDIGFWLRLFVSGSKLDEIELDEKTYDINFRVSQTITTPEDLSKLTIPTPSGRVPVQELGEFVIKPNPSIINREDGKRTIAVTGSVTEGGNIGQISEELGEFADTELNLETGYSWSTGGVNEENERSVQSIIMAMGLSAILILVTLVVQLGSFRKALVVMLVIPLALSGVFMLFALFQIPLSFPALIGMLALFGIVVNNSILVVEKINQNLAANIPYKESIADAVSSRFEPILLTSLTTIIGLAPITLSDPFWRGLGGAIICGLTVSGTILLFFIPTVYYMMMANTEEKQQELDLR